MKAKVLNELKTTFRPEFLNRVDGVVVFHSLSVEEIRAIVDLMLARVRERLHGQEIGREVSQEAKDHLIKLGYNADFGARPLRRVIDNLIEDALAEALLLGRFGRARRSCVDRGEEAGLSIEALGERTDEKTPVEAL